MTHSLVVSTQGDSVSGAEASRLAFSDTMLGCAIPNTNRGKKIFDKVHRQISSFFFPPFFLRVYFGCLFP